MVVGLDDVSVRYGSRWALARLSAEIRSGERVLLTGENGAGKTTLLRILSTIQKPTRGRLQLFGLDARQNLGEVRARLALITHQNHLYDDMTAWENLDLMARLSGACFEEGRRLLVRVGLEAHANRRVRHFSAGMKRRLCFARLLLRRPELVLLDEPFGQLDPQGVSLVESLIGEVKEMGATLIMSTHDLPRGLRLCDRHLTLAGGRKKGKLETIVRGEQNQAERSHE